jgi:hypothetical protein
MKGAPNGLALALLSNFKTDWKGFPRTNTSLLGLISVTKEKSFITLAPGADHPLVAVEPDGEVEALLHRLDAGSVEHFLQEQTVYRQHQIVGLLNI